MNIYIFANRKVVKNEVTGNNGENNAEIMQFHFPEQIVGIDMSSITKWIQFRNEEKELNLLQMIEDDKYSLTDLITQYESVDYQVLLKYNELVLWKSNIDTLDFGESLDIDVTITLDELSVLNQLRLQVIDLKNQYEQAIKDGQTDISDLIKRIEELESKITTAENSRVTAEEERVTAENARAQAETERNNTLKKIIEDVSETIQNLAHSIAEYNKNAETKLSELNSTASSAISGISSVEQNAIGNITRKEESSISAITKEKDNVIKAIESEVSQRITEIDSHLTDEVTKFDSNAISKTNAFNDNATSKTTAFDTNATNQKDTFNQNAQEKLDSFNSNSSEKLEEFNSNFENKKEEMNSEFSIDRISALENKVFEKETIKTESNSITLEDTEDGLNLVINEIESNKIEQEVIADEKPSIQNPSPVEGVSGDVNVKVQNLNILPILNIGADWDYEDNYIMNINKNAGVKLTGFNVKAGQTIHINFIIFEKPTADTSFSTTETKNSFIGIQNFEIGKIYTRTIEVAEDTEIRYFMWGNANFSIIKFQMWANIGEPKKYEKHKEQNFKISIGDKVLYKGDKIIRKDGKWYLALDYKKRIFDGNEDFSKSSTTTVDAFNINLNNISYPILDDESNKCNYFKRGKSPINLNTIGTFVITSNYMYFVFKSNGMTLDQFKNLVQDLYEEGKPLYTVCKLQETEYEEITDETLINQLNQLLRLKQYNNITYIEFNQDVSFEIEVSKNEINSLKNTIKEKEKIINGFLKGQQTETIEGDNITAHNCLELPIKDFKSYGKPLNQEVRQGYNHFKNYSYNNDSVSGSGITVTSQKDGKVLVNGTSTEGVWFEILCNFKVGTSMQDTPIVPLDTAKTYTVNVRKSKGTNSKNVNLSTQIFESSPLLTVQISSSDGNYDTFTNSNGLYRAFLYIPAETTCSNLELEIMVLEGEYTLETAPEYEKYGQSPSIDFESPVEYTEGNQEIEHSNKNIAYNALYYNPTLEYRPTITCDYQIKKDRYYAISCDTQNTGERIYPNTNVLYGFSNLSGWGNLYNQICDGKRKVWFAKAVNSGIYTKVPILNKSNTSAGNTEGIECGYTYNVMIEEIPNATTNEESLNYIATNYIEHQAQTYRLTNSPPLYNESDYIYYDENLNKYFKHNDYDKYIITGDENWILSGNTTATVLAIALSNVLPFIAIDGTLINSCMNMFQRHVSSNLKINEFNLYNSDGEKYKAFVLTFDRAIYPDIESAKAKLKELYENGTPAYLIYKTQKADEELTDKTLISQLNDFRKLFTYEGTNHFIVTSENGQPANLKVVVYKDGFKIMQNRVDKLEQAILNS